MEEIIWKQKLHIQWLKEGNNNTKFFHMVASCRRGINKINRIKVEEEVFEEKMRDKIEEFNRSLYSLWEYCPKLDGMDFKSIYKYEPNRLERPFEKEEVKGGVVWQLKAEKTPSLDSFPMTFLHAVMCWKIIKGDLMKVIRDFYERSFPYKGSNLTFILLF